MVAPPRPAPTPCTMAEIDSIGRSLGLDAVGVAPADPLLRARRILHERAAAGLHGGMAFTYKNPDRSTTPGAAVPGARSVIVGARSYLTESEQESESGAAHGSRSDEPDGPRAVVARYARADHYAPLRAALWGIAHHLRDRGWKAVAFADDNSVVDREVAWLAGIGWFGKNANLLLPRAGSWFVLGSVVTDAEFEPAASPVADGCGGCRRCLDGCPTGAIVSPGVVDANRCLAWLLQKPGVFPVEHRVALGDRLYGCDDCQEVCPPNQRFAAVREAAPGTIESVAVAEVLDSSDDRLIERFGRWYLHGRDPKWLRRNALVILGNVGDGTDATTVRLLNTHLDHVDPILRAHAVWAAHRLGRQDLCSTRRFADDPDPDVRAEWHAARGTT